MRQIDSARDFATLQTWAQTEQRTERAPAERAVTTGLLEPHLSQGGIAIRLMRPALYRRRRQISCRVFSGPGGLIATVAIQTGVAV